MSNAAETPEEILDVLKRLKARYGDRPQPWVGPSTPLVEKVMLLAQLLGAEDPYQALVFPDMLDRVITNTLPEWVLPTGMGLIEIEGEPPTA